jgi:hypothetical protein
MLKAVLRYARVVGAVVTIVTGAATLAGMANQALLDHLDKTFVTKEEFEQANKIINTKLDALSRARK